MKILTSTSSHDVAEKTKNVMKKDVIPNMLLKNAGKANGFISEKKDYTFWLKRICGRHS